MSKEIQEMNMDFKNKIDALKVLGYQPIGNGGIWSNGTHNIVVNFMKDGKVIINPNKDE